MSIKHVTSNTGQPGVSLRQLGERVRRERGERGIREVASDIRISPATLSRIERGFLPDIQTFGKLCRWLKLDPAEILGVDLDKGDDVALASRPRSTAIAHFRADRSADAELASALAEMILAAQDMLKLPPEEPNP